MKKETNYTPIVLTITLIIVVAIIGGYYIDKSSNNIPSENNQSQDISNPTIDVNPNTKVNATTIKVAQFYNGQDGFSISIPSGNRSTCIWNWEGGSGAIPDSTTTYANTATEKHTIIYYGGTYNYQVNCFDDFGNQYVGLFPSN